jgi:NAD(P) transhydrogenase subunit alpha
LVAVGAVKIMGFINLPARLAADSSALYARNLLALAPLLAAKEGAGFAPHWDDEIIQAAMLTRDGKVVHPSFAPAPAPGA